MDEYREKEGTFYKVLNNYSMVNKFCTKKLRPNDCFLITIVYLAVKTI
jgi:hypothetical protein